MSCVLYACEGGECQATERGDGCKKIAIYHSYDTGNRRFAIIRRTVSMFIPAFTLIGFIQLTEEHTINLSQDKYLFLRGN